MGWPQKDRPQISRPQISLESAKKTKAVVTAEEHTIMGGLGSAVPFGRCFFHVSRDAEVRGVGALYQVQA